MILCQIGKIIDIEAFARQLLEHDLAKEHRTDHQISIEGFQNLLSTFN